MIARVIRKYADRGQRVDGGDPVFDVTLEAELTFKVPVSAATEAAAITKAKSWFRASVQAAGRDACCGQMTDFKIL